MQNNYTLMEEKMNFFSKKRGKVLHFYSVCANIYALKAEPREIQLTKELES